MKLPKAFSQISQTLKRFTPNFNSCLPASLRTRQKPSDLPTEIDPLISDQNISDSSRPDQLTNSAGDFLAKPVIPISNTNNPTPIPPTDPELSLNQALDAFANKHRNINNRPVSGAGVFAMKEPSKNQTDLSSKIKPLEHELQNPLRRVNAITYQRRPFRPLLRNNSSSREATIPQHQILTPVTQATQVTQPQTINSQLPFTRLPDTFRQAYDSGSDSEVEDPGVAPEVMNMVGSFATNTADFLARNFTHVATSLFTGANSSNSSRPAPFPSLPTTQQPEIQPVTIQPVTQNSILQAQGQKNRVDLANEQLRLLLSGTKFRKSKISPEQKIQTEIHEPDANRTSPGKLRQELLDIYGGGVVKSSNDNIHTVSSNLAKKGGEIRPEIPPIPQPQQPLSPAQLTNMPSIPPEDPDFPNAEKIKAFNFINVSAGLEYNFGDNLKIRYFNASAHVINKNKQKVLAATALAAAAAAFSWGRDTGNYKIMTDDEKVKLFDYFNRILDFKTDGSKKEKIKKLNHLMIAISSTKSLIKTQLDKKITKEDELQNQTHI
jgi:hypothetical protein